LDARSKTSMHPFSDMVESELQDRSSAFSVASDEVGKTIDDLE